MAETKANKPFADGVQPQQPMQLTVKTRAIVVIDTPAGLLVGCLGKTLEIILRMRIRRRQRCFDVRGPMVG